jgi:DNA-binding transcriptional ArsR family regulator
MIQQMSASRVERALDAFGDPTRRRVFERLRHRARSVREIADGMDVSRPAVSQHLKVLQEAGLVAVRAEGTRRLYSVEWKRFGGKIRELVGEDPDMVFEHPGRQTFGASVFVAKKGGRIITCASTSGYMHEYDNRYLWMNLKRIVSSHFANYKEAWEANRLVDLGMIHPILSKTYALDDVAEAAWAIHTNQHTGKLGVLVNATAEGQGVQDAEKRAKHVGEIDKWKQLS